MGEDGWVGGCWDGLGDGGIGGGWGGMGVGMGWWVGDGWVSQALRAQKSIGAQPGGVSDSDQQRRAQTKKGIMSEATGTASLD